MTDVKKDPPWKGKGIPVRMPDAAADKYAADLKVQIVNLREQTRRVVLADLDREFSVSKRAYNEAVSEVAKTKEYTVGELKEPLRIARIKADEKIAAFKRIIEAELEILRKKVDADVQECSKQTKYMLEAVQEKFDALKDTHQQRVLDANKKIDDEYAGYIKHVQTSLEKAKKENAERAKLAAEKAVTPEAVVATNG